MAFSAVTLERKWKSAELEPGQMCPPHTQIGAALDLKNTSDSITHLETDTRLMLKVDTPRRSRLCVCMCM